MTKEQEREGEREGHRDREVAEEVSKKQKQKNFVVANFCDALNVINVAVVVVASKPKSGREREKRNNTKKK